MICPRNFIPLLKTAWFYMSNIWVFPLKASESYSKSFQLLILCKPTSIENNCISTDSSTVFKQLQVDAIYSTLNSWTGHIATLL